MSEAEKKYADIINLPHHTSVNRPRMSSIDRAAQFASFAALTGYDGVIDETGRLTDSMAELTEEMKAVLDQKHQLLVELADRCPEVVVTFFVPDARKAGGMYQTVTGRLKLIDEYERVMILTSGTRIPIDRIHGVECELFGDLFSDL